MIGGSDLLLGLLVGGSGSGTHDESETEVLVGYSWGIGDEGSDAVRVSLYCNRVLRILLQYYCI